METRWEYKAVELVAGSVITSIEDCEFVNLLVLFDFLEDGPVFYSDR